MSLRRRYRKPQSNINITPLIDVLLVLIVIFMVITPREPTGFEARIPVESSSVSPPMASRQAEPLILSIDRLGEIRLNREVLDLRDVPAQLLAAMSKSGERALFVHADGEVLYDEVAHLIDTARAAGADRIGLLSESYRAAP